jgi:hypothetical protein
MLIDSRTVATDAVTKDAVLLTDNAAETDVLIQHAEKTVVDSRDPRVSLAPWRWDGIAWSRHCKVDGQAETQKSAL